MARGKLYRYRQRRQTKPQEAFITLVVVAGFLIVASLVAVPESNLPELLFYCFVILVSVMAICLYFMERQRAAQREGLRQLKLDDVDTMPGIKFEEYVAELFRLQGYKIQTTAISGDYGVDLIVIKDGVCTAIQTKRYSKAVNQAAVREVVAGMKQYDCSQSMVITNNYFTKFAVDLAATNECVLVDRDKLAEMIALRDQGVASEARA